MACQAARAVLTIIPAPSTEINKTPGNWRIQLRFSCCWPNTKSKVGANVVALNANASPKMVTSAGKRIDKSKTSG